MMIKTFFSANDASRYHQLIKGLKDISHDERRLKAAEVEE
jgi:hypothetical protein